MNADHLARAIKKHSRGLTPEQARAMPTVAAVIAPTLATGGIDPDPEAVARSSREVVLEATDAELREMVSQ